MTKPPLMLRILRVAALIAGWTLLALLSTWAVAALAIDVRIAWLRGPLAVAYVLGVIAAAFLVKRKALGALLVAGGFLGVLGWWLLLAPSNDRTWQPDRVVLPWAEMAGSGGGERVTIHNIRNCNYRTETNYTVRHYDKTFDLAKLRSADACIVHWGSPLIAHTMLSFNFDGGDTVCFSIETRNEAGEPYSAIKGFFRQYELAYVIADERDAVRLRTNFRQGEEVYLYRLRITPERARALFLEYLRRANSLREKPEWYNALTSNCTTNIRLNADTARGKHSPFDWRILLNGRLVELLYERGAFASDAPLSELKERGHINARARAAGAGSDFSQQIREGIPGVNP